MSIKGILRTKEKEQLVEYYPQTTYDNVVSDSGGNLSTDISELKTFKDTAKVKLDGISENANKTEQSTTNGNIKIDGAETLVYTHPTGAGNLHIPVGGSKGQILRWSALGTAVWGDENTTTYDVVTQEVNGLMSAVDKIKLDGIAAGANNYVHPGTGTNPHGTTKADIGLGQVSNWAASSEITANSDTLYATTKMVALVRAEKSNATNLINGTAVGTLQSNHESTSASEQYAVAIGMGNKAFGRSSFAEGMSCTAAGLSSHAEGMYSSALENTAHAEGTRCTASGQSSHAEGWQTTSSGIGSHCEGENSESYGETSHCEGFKTTSSGTYSHAEGYSANKANMGDPSLSGTTMLNAYNVWKAASRARFAIAWGKGSHAEGGNCAAFGEYSHAEGYASCARGSSSHAEGYITTAIGNYSHAEGYTTTVNGNFGHVEGSNTSVTAHSAHAEGSYTTAETYAIHVQGQFNKTNSGTYDRFTATNNAFVIGNGTSAAKSNAFRVTFDGKTYGLSAFNSTGADYAEYFEWADGNPNNEDRIGRFVALDGRKIKIAESDEDYIVGIISGNQSIIGNASEDSWNDMYMRDRFDRLIYEDVEVEREEPVYNPVTGEIDVTTITLTEKHIKLNPDYDPEVEYIPRSERKEWGIVGMLGQIRVIDDGTCQVNGYCKPSKNGIATHTDDKSGYRVLERIDDNLIRVIMK